MRIDKILLEMTECSGTVDPCDGCKIKIADAEQAICREILCELPKEDVLRDEYQVKDPKILKYEIFLEGYNEAIKQCREAVEKLFNTTSKG